MQRMRVERKSGLLFKGRRVPFGGEILVDKPRDAKILRAILAASPIVDDESPRQVAAVLKAPSLARGPLVERAPAEIALLAKPLRDLAESGEVKISGEGVSVEVEPAARALFPSDAPSQDIPPGEDPETAQGSASESSVYPNGTAEEEVPPEAGETTPATRKGRGGRKPKAATAAGGEGAQ